MAVTLMTTTGTLDDVQTALGIPKGGETTPSGVLDTTSASVETLPSKTDVNAPPETPPVETPAVEPPPVTDEHVPDSEFDEDGEPTTERAARSSRTKLQTIKKLRVRAREAELRAARAEGELEARRAGVTAPVTPAVTAPAPSEATAPQEADFDTYEAYIKATAAHEARQAYRDEQAKHETAAEQRRLQTEQTQAQAAVQKRIEAFTADHPDYQDVVDNPDLILTPAIGYTLTTSEDGPAMAYALGKDPARFKRIAAMNPSDAMLELGVLRAELRASAPSKETASPAPTVKTPSAPPPPTPVRGRAVAASVTLEDFAKTIQPGDPATSEWLRRRSEQLAQRRQR